MKKHLSNTRRGDAEKWPTDLTLLKNPLDFIREDHMHMRVVCEAMERVAQGAAPDTEEIARLIHFVEREIGLLMQDEDTELRDLMLIRCPPEDDIAPILDRLRAEHAALGDACPALLSALRSMAEDARAACADEAALLRDFADRLRRHLIVENGIVLPIARARLTDADMVRLRDGMIRRRIDATGG